MPRLCASRVLHAAAGALAAAAVSATAATLQVGSKRFTESYILGEIVAQTARGAGTPAQHQRGMGNTAILINALRAGSIDLYPEYTGTIAREILKLPAVPPLAELNARLAREGLTVAVPLGFNNTYALAMRAGDAAARGIARISDLKRHRDLRFGLSQEFLGRADGWPGLVRAYGFDLPAPRGIDHGLAYEAIAGGLVDVIDIYSTDAKLDKYRLTVLADDANFFPRYDAVLLVRADVPQRFPQAWAALAQLAGSLDEAAVRRLNAAAELDGRDFAAIAADWLAQRAGGAARTTTPPGQGLWRRIVAPDFGRLLAEHVALVFFALAASCALGVPLGVLAARRQRAAPVVFGVTGVIQTIPALALLAFLIPITGRIGPVPAFIALTLYALLPIVRNTHAGIAQIPRETIEAATALSLRPAVVFWKIELPLALPTLLAGVKTSAVVNVGTATIAAFIGAGGFGERIVTGLALNDQTTLLAGAIPVALLALAVQGAFDALERRLVPAGLRHRR
ncbi:MAG TPA: glycine betaine ABC transporter substrate-binding protein [Burkholderiaceae bacterium]|jgi:osmoprotectant transport system permease protein|nr:glycine betaine ABC transporter substrate-binding protein [Burkholderiaceae bacterium]